MTYQTSTRLSKSLLAFCVGIFCFIVGLNNIVDFDTNFQFVQHVLSMDTMHDWFKGDALRGRAIVDQTFHLFGYCLIILCQILSGLICLFGAIKMITNLHSEDFNSGRSLYITGATIAILVWYLGFGIIGAEWFVMWANVWNGQQSAYNFSIFILISMCYVQLKE